LRHWPPGTIQNTVRAVFFLKPADFASPFKKTPPRSLNAMHPSNERESLQRRSTSPKTIYLITTLVLFGVAILAGAPVLRREHFRLIVLRNQVEVAAAPDEPVLVDNWLLYRFLKSKGSTDLQRQLVYMRPSKPLPAEQELIVVTTETSSLFATLHRQRFDLKPNATQAAWIATGNGVRLPVRGFVRIYFAMPASSSHPETEQP
jgi:hypothetical protein